LDSIMPLISVIVPVYNGALTIRETLESVLQQSCGDFELLVIDDGSIDETIAVVQSITDPRIHCFPESNAGVAVSRNRGIARAKGQYLAFLDADDLWTVDKLADQLRALEQNPLAAVAYSWTDYIGETGQWLKAGGRPRWQGQVYEQMLVRCFLENGSNPLIRATALATIGGFNPAMVPGEDWDLYLRLAQRYEFAVVPKAQILYRQRAGSASSNIRQMEQAGVKAIDRAFAATPEALQPLKAEALADFSSYLFHRATIGPLHQVQGGAALRNLWRCYRAQPSFVLKIRKQLMLKAVVGLFLAIIKRLIPQ
jgi:glycosyltransferase involved in cell wall biosynthesis